MARERSGISLLLGLLLLFSSVLGVIYAKNNKMPQQPIATSGLTTVSVERAIGILMPLMLSDSVEKIVEALQGLPIATVRPILIKMVADGTLSKSSLMQIIFGVALYYQGDEQAQKSLFDIILNNFGFKPRVPLLAIAGYSSYPTIIPAVLAWAKKEQAHIPWLKDIALDSLKYVVDKNNIPALLAMRTHGVVITPDMATQLLWQVVNDQETTDMAIQLLAFGANVNAEQGGYTPLIKAVMTVRPDLVKEFIQAGADVQRIVKDSVGSALQVVGSMERAAANNKERLAKLVEIETLLRGAGARNEVIVK